MTVHTLIRLLSQYPPDTQVVLPVPDRDVIDGVNICIVDKTWRRDEKTICIGWDARPIARE